MTAPQQLIRFILKTSSPLSKNILIFPKSEKYFLCYSTFIYLFFLCHHSNSPMSSINHPKNRGQKTVFFRSFFAPKSLFKPLYVVVNLYFLLLRTTIRHQNYTLNVITQPKHIHRIYFFYFILPFFNK